MSKALTPKAAASIGALIAREEWDFSACPEDRLGFCFAYEFAREMPEIIARFRHAQEHDPSQFDQHGQWHHIIVNDTRRYGGCETFELLDVPRGFPKVPYLKTTHHIHAGSSFPYTAGYRPLRPVIMKPDGGYDPDPRCVREPVFTFQIDLRFPDRPILAAMAAWLKEAHGDREPMEMRGQSEARQCRRDLKALGAVRLTRHFIEHGGTMADAADYASDQGAELYAEMTDWSEAKRHVQKIIDQWLK